MVGPNSEIPQQQSAKDKEASKPSRVNKKAVKGFYYYASEYQRQKQQERTNPVHKMFRGIIEPLAIHQRALRLRIAAARNGGGPFFANKFFGNVSSAVLDTEFVRQTMDSMTGRNVDQKVKDKFKARSQAHAVIERSQMSEEQITNARDAIQAMLASGGNVDAQEYATKTGLSKDEVKRLTDIIKASPDAFTTPQKFQQEGADQILYGGLSPKQQEQARALFYATTINTALTALNYGKTALIVTFLASNPVGWGATIGIAAVSGAASFATRASRLIGEGKVYDISTSRNIDVKTNHGFFTKLLSVDWEQDSKTRAYQLIRASAFGALVAVGARVAPEFLHDFVIPNAENLLHQGQDLLHNVGGAAANGAHNLADKFPHGGGNGAGVAALADKGDLNIGAGNFHENFLDAAKDHVVHYLPDTAHHDWQQLHTFVQQEHLPNGQTVNEIKLSYNGVDDGIPHDQHYIDVMMGNGQHVFLQNDTILAVNGPDANLPIPLFDAPGHIIGYTHGVNLANELGLTQGKIDNFANLTEYAKNGHWFGTQNASDLQKILQDRGIYPNNGDNGEYLWGYRLGGGYFGKNGDFYIGASNHYFSGDALHQYTPVANFAGLQGDIDPQLHSFAAAGLQNFDDLTDRGLEAFREAVENIASFTTPVVDWLVNAADAVTDFGIANTDGFLYLAQTQPGLAALEAGLVMTAGGLIGSHAAKTKVGKWGKRVLLGGTTLVSPPLAAAGLVGMLAGKALRGRKKKSKSGDSGSGTSGNGNQNSGGNGGSSGGGGGGGNDGNGSSGGTSTGSPTNGTGGTGTTTTAPVTGPTDGTGGDNGGTGDGTNGTITAPPPAGNQPPAAPVQPPIPSPEPTGNEPVPVELATVAATPFLLGALERIPGFQPVENLITNGRIELEKLTPHISSQDFANFVNLVYQPVAQNLGIQYNPDDMKNVIETLGKDGNKVQKLYTLIKLGDILHQISSNSDKIQALKNWLGSAKEKLAGVPTGGGAPVEAADAAKIGELAGEAETAPELAGTGLGEVLGGVAAEAGEEAAAILPELLPLLVV